MMRGGRYVHELHSAEARKKETVPPEVVVLQPGHD